MKAECLYSALSTYIFLICVYCTVNSSYLNRHSLLLYEVTKLIIWIFLPMDWTNRNTLYFTDRRLGHTSLQICHSLGESSETCFVGGGGGAVLFLLLLCFVLPAARQFLKEAFMQRTPLPTVTTNERASSRIFKSRSSQNIHI